MAALLATVVALIVYLTLSPFEFNFASRHINVFVHLLHSWPVRMDRGFLRDSILNIALFLPLGITACLTYAHHWSRRTAVGCAVMHGFALSLCIEILQYYDASRFSSSSDIFFNTLGTLLGAVLGLTYQHRIERFTNAAERRGAPAGVLLAGCWLGSQLYPFVPMVRSSQLSMAWRVLVASPLSWIDVAAGAAGWFVFGLALRAIWGKLPWAWLALAMLATPLRLVIWDRVVTTSDIAAAALGLFLWCVVGDSMRPGAGWLLMLAAVVLRELAPFHFNAPVHPFSWIPFGATMTAEHAPGVTVILRKAFEYGSLVWLLNAGKYRHWTAGIMVAIGLFVMELMQTHMAGRTAEITDSVLALLMALILNLLV